MSQIISARSGEIAASGVTFEEYLQSYAADFHEFIKGTVIKMSPIHERQDQLTRYGAMLSEAYFDLRPIGKIRQGPIVMRIRAHDIFLESVFRDHGEKFEEYEFGGVGEYWILDPMRNESRFYRLNAPERYMAMREDAEGYYQTPPLPEFRLHVPTLWEKPLPGYGTIWESIRAALGQ